MKVMRKYQPLKILLFFIVSMLLLALFLSFIRFIFEGGSISSIFYRLEGFVFLSFFAILLGIIFCEIKALIQSKIWGAIIFGMVTSQLFIICLFVSSLLTDGSVKEMPENMYLFFTLVFTPLLSAIYFGMVGKTPNK